jgi:hypothetical protein
MSQSRILVGDASPLSPVIVEPAMCPLPKSPTCPTPTSSEDPDISSFEIVARCKAPSEPVLSSKFSNVVAFMSLRCEDDSDEYHDSEYDAGSTFILPENDTILVESPDEMQPPHRPGTPHPFKVEEDLRRKFKSTHSGGNDLEAALDFMKIAQSAVHEKRIAEERHTAALRQIAQLQQALHRSEAQRRNAIVAAEELTYTNNSLHVMISDLQGHILNQQDAEEQTARMAGQMVRREYHPPSGSATLGAASSSYWHHPLWLSVGHLHPALKAAEAAWWRHGQLQDPQAALLCVQTVLKHRQSDIAVEKDAHAPLSEIGILANLLRCTILLVADQHQQALSGAENMIHEARASGLTAVERRAQWLRGHSFLALKRPQEARICFSFCGGPGMPENAVRAMRDEADHQIEELPLGHSGRELSEDFAQFYYSWAE